MNTETPAEFRLRWFLQLSGVMMLLAIIAVIMPFSWMDAVHGWLGFGTMPTDALFGYLARSLSALYAALGACYWFLARDLRRYMPLIRFCVPVSFAFVCTIIALDFAVGMPTMWTLLEAVSVLSWTLLLWLLVRQVNAAAQAIEDVAE